MLEGCVGGVCWEKHSQFESNVIAVAPSTGLAGAQPVALQSKFAIQHIMSHVEFLL